MFKIILAEISGKIKNKHQTTGPAGKSTQNTHTQIKYLGILYSNCSTSSVKGNSFKKPKGKSHLN